MSLRNVRCFTDAEWSAYATVVCGDENQRRFEENILIVEDYVLRNKDGKDFGKFPVAFNYLKCNEFRVSSTRLLEITKRQEGDK